MKTILITGVSSGIGYAAAQTFLNSGYHVFGSVRKEADAARLQAEFGSDFTPLLFDVTDTDALQRAAQQVSEIVGDRGLSGLINNAGIATTGPLLYQSIDEIRWQFEVNVIATIATIAVVQAFLPLLKVPQAQTGKPGKIINIGSISGKLAAPFVGAYVGSKHALEGISDTLRRELVLQGVDVIMVAPGLIKTPIWDKGASHDFARYDATEYGSKFREFHRTVEAIGKLGFPAEKVARLIQKVFELKHPKARYALVPNPILNWILPLALPARWLDKLVGKSLMMMPVRVDRWL